ncbi:MAG: nodulation protein NfeD [Deltaproteobacteria bacterium]|nr:nodulation protein NfeD [Deltaproteobacteria bacterium]
MITERIRIVSIALVCCCLALMIHPFLGEAGKEEEPVVFLLDINGTINPALSDYISKGIEKAEAKKATCVIIRMDTPGGVLSTTKTIIKDMVNAKLPVVVYVAPSGSSAASAGALITVCADIAAMAPGTNIGAAHPVSGGGQEIDSTMSEKIMNDMTAYIRGIVTSKGRNAEWPEKAIRESVSITAKEALDLKVIDLVADSIPDLLQKLNGRKIEKENHEYVLQTEDAKIERIIPGFRFKILDVIANPNIAYILMMVGGLGIMMELFNPGLIFPGVTGGICLLLSFFALQVLPVSYVGILLIILSVILFILEIKVQSFGLFSVGGIISLTLGSVMLFDSSESAMRVSWSVIVPTVLAVSAFFIFVLGLVIRAWMHKPRTGPQGLVGEVGVAMTDIDPTGKVLVHGEYWNAKSEIRIPKGETVRVTKVMDLEISVAMHGGL